MSRWERHGRTHRKIRRTVDGHRCAPFEVECLDPRHGPVTPPPVEQRIPRGVR
jgi:hypothetical protein